MNASLRNAHRDLRDFLCIAADVCQCLKLFAPDHRTCKRNTLNLQTDVYLQMFGRGSISVQHVADAQIF